MSDYKRAQKKRGIQLATAGWVLALSVLLVMRLNGLSQVSYAALAALLLGTLALQSALWLVPHLGWDRALRSDPHYLYLPIFGAVVILSVYAYAAPEASSLLLMGWFVALLFLVGIAGPLEVVMLSGLVALGQLAALSLRALGGYQMSLAFVAVQILVFFAICSYAAFVFRRLQNERRKMLDLRRDLVELAIKDPLTELPNRRHFERLLRDELARIQRYGGRCSVAMLDVDHFKIYNDTLGHLAGDDVLRDLSRLLEANLRESDVASRYGGEEFAVILINTGTARAWEVVDRLRSAIEQHDFPHEEILPGGQLTISGGIAGFTRDTHAYEAIVQAADQALYAAKHAGRNRVELAA